MFDPYSTSELPIDLSKWIASSWPHARDRIFVPESAGRPFSSESADLEGELALPILDRWDVVTHQYRREAAADVGFFSKLFQSKVKSVEAGVTQEAKQYALQKTKDGRQIEIGVAVRLAVATSKYEVSAELSVPNLAAAAQLGLADTRIGIYVVGFRGSIGDIMPAPADLNVENFAGFMEAFTTI